LIKIYFSGEDSLYAVIREYVKNAKRRVWAELFWLSSDEIVDLLKDAGRRGVDVKILLDFNSTNEEEWAKGGVMKNVGWGKLRFGSPTFFWAYHLKMGIVDDVVLFGSANWSYSGMIKNREGLIVTDEPEILVRCEQIFSEDWGNGILDLRHIKRRGKFHALLWNLSESLIWKVLRNKGHVRRYCGKEDIEAVASP
jgi:phosphatidylserine/phosphatidylglycerophosphate/cardiolipin synthase-like enzyme